MPAEEGVKFGDPLTYPYMTVASPSSHDTSTTRGWWEHEVPQRQEFFAEARLRLSSSRAPQQCIAAVHLPSLRRSSSASNYALLSRFTLQMLGGEGPAPKQCTPAVLEHILQQHMDSPSLLAIFPLQDLLPLSTQLPDCPPRQQQINDPTNPQHYWRYRLHVTLEEIAADDGLRCLLSDMLQASMRFHGAAPDAVGPA